MLASPLLFPARGVAQDCDSIAEMAGAQGAAGKQSSFDTEIHFGQVTEDVSKSGSKEAWHVLQEHELRSQYANDLRNPRPEPPRVIDSEAQAGTGDWLTGESSCDNIDDSDPRLWVKSGDIVPDGDPGEPGLEDLLTELVFFDEADGLRTWFRCAQSKLKAAQSGTDTQDIQSFHPFLGCNGLLQARAFFRLGIVAGRVGQREPANRVAPVVEQ